MLLEEERNCAHQEFHVRIKKKKIGRVLSHEAGRGGVSMILSPTIPFARFPKIQRLAYAKKKCVWLHGDQYVTGRIGSRVSDQHRRSNACSAGHILYPSHLLYTYALSPKRMCAAIAAA